jgi:HEPN domain-containing protein/stress-induced morphogen
MSGTTVRPSLGVLDPELRRYIEANWERILRVFNPRHLIAFGSRVNGTAKPDSDLDLIVVSDAFEGIPFLQRSRMFNEQVPWHLRVDAWCYTVREFERLRRQIGIVADACREGLWLLRSNLLSDEEVSGVMTPEEQARKWIAQGDHDLNLARIAYANDSYEWAAAIAQQAAEKFLKALYIVRFQATPPRTHDLEALANTLGAPPELAAFGRPLTEDYLRARYPDIAGGVPHEIFDATTAEERIAQAERIRDWVIQQLGQGG